MFLLRRACYRDVWMHVSPLGRCPIEDIENLLRFAGLERKLSANRVLGGRLESWHDEQLEIRRGGELDVARGLADRVVAGTDDHGRISSA